MSYIKHTIRTATCTAFILALAAVSNTASLFAAGSPSAVDSNQTFLAGDNTLPLRNDNKKQKPGMKNNASANVTAAYEVDGAKQRKAVMLKDKKVVSTRKNQSVIAAFNNASLVLNRVTMEKTGDTSNEDGSAFFGLNAALVSLSGSKIVTGDCAINTNAEGANAVFATGTNSEIIIRNITIYTKQDGSRGLDATDGGAVTAFNATIVTQGAHSASLATDRGGGTITVHGGTAETHGEGSPVLYSTGDITADHFSGKSAVSEIGVIEGKNSLTIKDGVYSNNGTNGFMLYQSTSGDAEEGTARFTAENATFTQNGNGAFIYTTNTDAEASLVNCTINAKSNVLVNAAGNNSERGWGRRGQNGSTLRLSLANMKANGDILCDAISTVAVTFGPETFYTGALNAKGTGTVSVSLDSRAQWTLTADSYVSSFADTRRGYTNIKSNGHTIYYDVTNSANSELKGRRIALEDGGAIKPYTLSRRGVAMEDNTSDNNRPQQQAQNGGQLRKVQPRNDQPGNGMFAPQGDDAQDDVMQDDVTQDDVTQDDITQDDVTQDNGRGRTDVSRQQSQQLDDLSGVLKVSGKGKDQRIELVAKDGKKYLLTVMTIDGKPGAARGRQQPNPVTVDDLLKLNGKKVQLRGFYAGKNQFAFTVMECEEVKAQEPTLEEMRAK